MLTTVQGTYENGVVRLNEPVPATLQGRVIVTFLPETPAPAAPPTSPDQPRFSWDKALARTASSAHVSVADEVIAERNERG